MCHRRLPNPMNKSRYMEMTMPSAADIQGAFDLWNERPRHFPVTAGFLAGWNATDDDKEIDMTLPKMTATGSLTTTSPNFGPQDIKHLDVKPSDNGGFLVRVFYDNGPSKHTFHYVAVSQNDLTFVLSGIANNRYVDPPAPVKTQEPGWVGTYPAKPLPSVRSFL